MCLKPTDAFSYEIDLELKGARCLRCLKVTLQSNGLAGFDVVWKINTPEIHVAHGAVSGEQCNAQTHLPAPGFVRSRQPSRVAGVDDGCCERE
jgi:hypothetical protein